MLYLSLWPSSVHLFGACWFSPALWFVNTLVCILAAAAQALQGVVADLLPLPVHALSDTGASRSRTCRVVNRLRDLPRAVPTSLVRVMLASPWATC
jgi:hypothetical protein